MRLPLWMIALIASAGFAEEKQMTKFDLETDVAGQLPKDSRSRSPARVGRASGWCSQ
jgi:hypothetical protein